MSVNMLKIQFLNCVKQLKNIAFGDLHHFGNPIWEMEHLVQGPIHLYVILSQLSTLRYGQMHLYVIQSELSTSRYGLSAPLPGFGRACPHGSNLVNNITGRIILPRSPLRSRIRESFNPGAIIFQNPGNLKNWF